MAESVQLPVIDISSSDRISTANSIRQACIEYGFFYLINHGISEELLQTVFDESKKFFSLPLEEKLKLSRKGDVGFAPIYAENLDSSSTSKGDLKETFHIGPLEGEESRLNLWPSKGTPNCLGYNLFFTSILTIFIKISEILPSWRMLMEKYYKKVLCAGKELSSLIALALNLDDDYFEKIGASDNPFGFLRLLHYPGEGEIAVSDSEVVYGASAHSDYGMITLLATDGVRGLQAIFHNKHKLLIVVYKSVCKDKYKQPRTWENVSHVKGTFIVNVGDMMERWTNCLFRSTLHRVMPTGKDRYSIAFFFDPNQDCIVECLKSCCSESNPPRFPPIRSGDYLRERINAAYSSSK
ncbi:hypothetical protein LXL04_030370 [Taraxacum kok-saghyz]